MRHGSTLDGRWTTVDYLWPVEKAYVYSSQRPAVLVDPSGLQCDAAVVTIREALTYIYGLGRFGCGLFMNYLISKWKYV